MAVTTANGQDLTDQLGITGVNLGDDWTSGPTSININQGFSNPVIGYVNSLPWDRYERTWEFASTLTKLKGNHTVKFGVDWRHNTDMLLQTQDNQGPRGGYTFSAPMTALPSDSASSSGIANAFAAFLLDRPSGIARDLKVIDNPGQKHWAFFSFVHDKWQLSKNVTLDLGLRWEYYDPFVGIAGKGSLSNYDPSTNSLLISGYGNNPLDIGVKKDLNNFAPRLGVSYRLGDKTVARAGFGGSTTPFPDNRYAFNYPVKQNNSFQGANSYSPAGSMAAGFPPVYTATVPENGIIPADTAWLTSQSFKYVPTDLQQGTIYSYNVAFQHEIIWNITAEVAFVGNYSNDVLNRIEMNAGMTPGLDNAGRPLYVYNKKTSSVEDLAWKGKTRYNGLQIKVDRRFRGGWLITNSYTYGHSKDYATDNGGPSTPADPGRSWGYSAFDRAHTYVGTFVWALPWFKEGNPVAKWVLGYWQLSGILSLMSGQALDITMSSSAALRAPGNTNRPDLVGTFDVTGNLGPGQKWFDTTNFSIPASATFGNAGRNTMSGPGYWNLDMSIIKKFIVTERVRSELRLETFNMTNTPVWGQPTPTFGSTDFGVVAAGGRRLMQLGLKLYW